ncbi:MAG: S9 family peptidase [Chlamydiae bacterium CG10_big_fil_rev_8_21_14_0_10_35_9]|nr:MAG: S9 family peptidase [Chlamydiae bacterium CG10_big_fil_rev_8_21_14_0_10_35_9]
MTIISTILSFGLLLMGSPTKSSIEEVALIPRKEIFGNPEYANPQVSPNGKLLAYLAPNEQGVSNIWVRTIGKKDDKVVTNDQNRGIRDFQWQYDNQHLIYLKDIGGDENWHLFQVNTVTERVRDLTPFEKARAEIIAYEPSKPNHMLIGLNKRDRRFHDAYLLNLEDGEIALIEENPGNIVQYAADRNLQLRAILLSKRDGGYTVRTREKENTPFTDLIEWDIDDQRNNIIGFSQDNQTLFMNTSKDSNTKRLLQVHINTKKPIILFENPSYDLKEVFFQPVTYKTQAVNFYGKYQGWSFLDNEFEKDFTYLKKQLPGNISIINRDLNDTIWVVGNSRDISSPKYFLFERSSHKLSHLFDARPKLNTYKLSKMRPFSFKARDGMTIYGYYSLPPVKKTKFPAVMLVKGGPWTQDKWDFKPMVQWLTNRGYAVIQVNYRGSTGFGKQYTSASKKQWGAKMHDDLIDAKKWAVEQKIIDPNKIAIVGGSYGGYSALVGLTFTPEEFCCGVSYVGPSNLVTLLKTIPPYWYALKAAMVRYIGDPDSEQELLRARSPLFKVDQITKPLLIAQGANDPRVVQAESDQIVKAMRNRNMDVEYLLFPDEGHGFVKPDNRIKVFAATEKFLQEYLGGRMEKVDQDEEWDIVKN